MDRNSTVVRMMQHDEVDNVIAFIKGKGELVDDTRFRFVFKSPHDESGLFLRLLSHEGKVVGAIIGHCATSLLNNDKVCQVIFMGIDAQFLTSTNEARLFQELTDWAQRRRAIRILSKGKEIR